MTDMFPPRNGHYGTVGRPLRVYTNCISFSVDPNINLYIYHVEINKDTGGKLNKERRREVWNQFLRLPDMQAFTSRAVYDDASLSFAAQPLPASILDRLINLELNTRVGRPGARPPPRFNVLIRPAGKPSSQGAVPVNAQDINSYLNGHVNTKDALVLVRPYLQALDVLFRDIFTSVTIMDTKDRIPFFSGAVYVNYEPWDRRGNDKKRMMDLGGGLEIQSGVYMSVRPGERRLLLNVDTTQTAFFKPIPVDALVCELLDLRTDGIRGLDDWQWKKVKGLLKNVKFKVQHGPYAQNPRTFKIRDVTRESADQKRFVEENRETNETREVTIPEYFYKRYNIRLRRKTFPCLYVFDPFQLCVVVPGQRFPGLLSPRQTAEMIKFSAVLPNERRRRVEDAILGHERLTGLDLPNKPQLREFGITVNPKLLTVSARQLNVPELTYGDDQRMIPTNGAWNLRGQRFYETKTLHAWSVVSFSNSNQVCQAFIRNFVDMAHRCGINVVTRSPHVISGNPHGNIEQMMRDATSAAHKEWTSEMRQHPPQLVMVILPSGPQADAVYARVKKCGETEVGVVTQCIKGEQAGRAGAPYLANVCLKVNAKLGGINAVLRQREQIFDVPTMVIGADVSHPAPGASSRTGVPSIAAVVGSMDQTSSIFCAETSSQEANSELIGNLSTAIFQLLGKFMDKNRCPVMRIIFFRDGLSDGQQVHTGGHEIHVIKEAIDRLRQTFPFPNDGVRSSFNPKLTYIVANKRHHLRFFPENAQDADRSQNLSAGTVIDRDVVHPRDQEFYLFGQAGLKGTSRPTRYCVLLDENNLSANDLQRITFNSCFTYARCTRSVSLVPAVYYAHLVAKRARLYLQRAGSDTASVQSGGERMPPAVLPEVERDTKNTMYFL